MSDHATEGMTEALLRIEALEGELKHAQRTLAVLEANTPRGCHSPEHAAAPSRIAELESALAKAQSESSGRFKGFLARLDKDRPKRLRAEIARLEQEVAAARPTARGKQSLLAMLKELRLQRAALLAEAQTLRSELASVDGEHPGPKPGVELDDDVAR